VRFIVDVPVTLTVQLIIEAPDADGARTRACVFATQGPGGRGNPAETMRALLAHPPASSHIVEICGAVVVHPEPAAPDVPTCNQDCVRCGYTSLKSEWGPGQMTCPVCKGTPPAACVR
jgi:hypothetical protein